MHWILISILSGIGFSTANALAKNFPNKIDSQYALIIFATVGIITSITGIILVRVLTGKEFILTNQGVMWAAAAGVAWGVGQTLFFITLKDAPLSLAVPLVVGILGVGGVVAGVLFFHESLTTIRIVGVTVVILGALLLSRS